MKRIFLSLIVLSLGLAVSAQQPVVILKNGAPSFEVKNGGSVTVFDLHATADDAIRIQKEANQYTGVVELVATPSGAGIWSCIMTVSDDNSPAYVHKLLLSFGITEFKKGGKTFPIQDIAQHLTN